MIYFDMDGVLAIYTAEDYETGHWLDKGYFRTRPVDNIMGEVFKRCLHYFPDNVCVLTSVPNKDDRNAIIIDKMTWLNEHFPEFDLGTHFQAVSSDKQEFIVNFREQSLNRRDILIDDYNPNLYGWLAKGGTSIKYLNGINSDMHWQSKFVLDCKSGVEACLTKFLSLYMSIND